MPDVTVDDDHVGLADKVKLADGPVGLVDKVELADGPGHVGLLEIELDGVVLKKEREPATLPVTVADEVNVYAFNVELDDGHVGLLENDGVGLENEREAARVPATVVDDVNEFTFKVDFAEGVGGFGNEGTIPVDAISTSKYKDSEYIETSASVHILPSTTDGTPGAAAKSTGNTDVVPARDDRECTVVEIPNSVFSSARMTEGTAPKVRHKYDTKMSSCSEIMIFSNVGAQRTMGRVG